MEQTKTEYYKIYSLNLAAFILMITKIEPILTHDEEKGKGFVNFLYPVCDEVRLIKQIYKQTNVSVDLHSYLNAYKDIRMMISEYRKRGD